MLGLARRQTSIIAVLFLAFVTTGCARVEPVKCFPVTGRVLVKGQPVAYARVTFHPLQDQLSIGQFPYATTNADGQFQLTTDAATTAHPWVNTPSPLSCASRSSILGRWSAPAATYYRENSPSRRRVTWRHHHSRLQRRSRHRRAGVRVHSSC